MKLTLPLHLDSDNYYPADADISCTGELVVIDIENPYRSVAFKSLSLKRVIALIELNRELL